MRTILYSEGVVQLIDQTRLPAELVYLDCRTWQEVAAAIREMRIRGAPAIGVSAAYGLALAAQACGNDDPDIFVGALSDAADGLARTRPTAVNLFWALEQGRSAQLERPRLAPRRHGGSCWRSLSAWRTRMSRSTGESAASARSWCPTARTS